MLFSACKTTSFCFTFVLVIVNSMIWLLVLKITWWEVLVVNVLMKLLGISRFRCVFHITQVARNVGLMLTISFKHNFSEVILDDTRKNSCVMLWLHSPLKRNPWVMFCSHFPINDLSDYLINTVYLAVMFQASWHTTGDN